jgi:hypothetical protein
MTADTATLILTSAVVAALVSTIIGGAFTMWNDRLRREHESQMLVLADRRAQRDRRGDRIYGNLHTIVDAALAIVLQVQILRSVPQKYKDAAPEMAVATEKLKAVQPAIRLDRETDALYERVVKAVYAYNLWWIALDVLDRARDSADPRFGEYTKDAAEQGEKLAALLDEIIVGARAALEEAEAAL